MENTVYKNSVCSAKAKFHTPVEDSESTQDRPKKANCKHAASGCDYPIGECMGLCVVNQEPSR